MERIQQHMALMFIWALDRVVDCEEDEQANGYNWYIRSSDKIMGFVRYNVQGENRYLYTIYTNTDDFYDPRRMFFNEHRGQPAAGWRATVDPDNGREIRYVLRLMRRIMDGSS